MDKYANMRGTFFAKHLKSNGNCNLVNKMSNNQATRTKVLNAVVTAKTVTESKEEREKQLWEDAGKNVQKYADTEIARACEEE